MLSFMKIANEEIRSLVVKAYLSGSASRQQLSQIFGYTTVSIGNWIREYEHEKRLCSRPRGHMKAAFNPEELKELSALLETKVDLTLSEIREHFGKTCSLTAIHNTVAKLGFVFKKNGEGQRTRSS